MPRLTKAQKAEYDALLVEAKAANDAAAQAVKDNPCQETREARTRIWNEYNARLTAIKPPPKATPLRYCGNKAGVRQYQQRQAEQQQRELDAASRRRWNKQD